ncbi:hypothetical protein LTS08_007731 [Lithohypha guttulata]|nr:hypothetical protein LTS08_007731 [Lithohypha guttulata]
MSDEKKATIPAWQQAASHSDAPQQAADSTTQDEKPSPELLDVARHFLNEDEIRDASREDKVEFLKEKGLPADAIDQLLSEGQDWASELKTVHDTTQGKRDVQETPTLAPRSIVNSTTTSTTISEPKRDVPPIITYPEFLVKPQKPPPLVTVERLVHAGYAIAGVSALTWAASKYIIEPMLQTLTEARHDFASTTLDDLEKFNDKLEGLVSHVPYIATSAVKKLQDREDDDVESLDSDPTELFHRDIATQTTPGLSRSSSEVELSRPTLDSTIAQSQRLSGLAYAIRSLVDSMEHSSNNEKYLQKTLEDFQGKLDTMESSYSMLTNNYYSTYSSANGDAKKSDKKEQEATKFKQEIRALKGAFLSSRNFPTAPRTNATVTAGGHGSSYPSSIDINDPYSVPTSDTIYAFTQEYLKHLA